VFEMHYSQAYNFTQSEHFNHIEEIKIRGNGSTLYIDFHCTV